MSLTPWLFSVLSSSVLACFLLLFLFLPPPTLSSISASSLYLNSSRLLDPPPLFRTHMPAYFHAIPSPLSPLAYVVCRLSLSFPLSSSRTSPRSSHPYLGFCSCLFRCRPFSTRSLLFLIFLSFSFNSVCALFSFSYWSFVLFGRSCLLVSPLVPLKPLAPLSYYQHCSTKPLSSTFFSFFFSFPNFCSSIKRLTIPSSFLTCVFPYNHLFFFVCHLFPFFFTSFDINQHIFLCLPRRLFARGHFLFLSSLLGPPQLFFSSLYFL